MISYSYHIMWQIYESAVSLKWTVGNMTSWGLCILTISFIFTSKIHGVAAIQLPVSLVGGVAKPWAEIYILLIVFRFVTFVTAAMELMSMPVPWCKNIGPSSVKSQCKWCNSCI